MTPKQISALSAVRESNAQYLKEKKTRKSATISIVVFLLFSLVSGTVTYFEHRKDEKMRDYGFCSMQCRSLSGLPLDPNSATPEEVAICYAECSEEYGISYREYSQWRMENDHPWF